MARPMFLPDINQPTVYKLPHAQTESPSESFVSPTPCQHSYDPVSPHKNAGWQPALRIGAASLKLPRDVPR